jgi:hypothetical protein
MPDFAKLDIDPTALMALGFLGVILLVTFILFGWLMAQGGKRKSG